MLSSQPGDPGFNESTSPGLRLDRQIRLQDVQPFFHTGQAQLGFPPCLFDIEANPAVLESTIEARHYGEPS
jgi:hypothetical protein